MQMASMTIISTPEREDDERRCGWCGASLAGRRQGTKFCNEKHKMRKYRADLQVELRAAGLPTRLNLKTARATRTRHGDARKRRKPDLRVSYRKAVDAVAAELERFSSSDVPQRQLAERALAPLLTDRQRAALKERS
jgi:hypothetical protein